MNHMTRLMLKRWWHTLKTGSQGWVAERRLGFPARNLQVYGITGTDGKTTSATMLYHVLMEAGWNVALISTVAARIGDEEIDTGFHVTSPQPGPLHTLLRRCRDAGIEHVVLEVTAHGMFQRRLWGVEFVMSGLTNITREHLDYFHSMQAYTAAKAELFSHSHTAILPSDDEAVRQLRRLLRPQTVVQEYRVEPANTAVGRAMRERFPEPYNLHNASLVVTMARELGIADTIIARALRSFPGVRGRMEEIANDRGVRVIVDFAHTPNGLESALTAVRGQAKGSVIAVFGCAGLRDVGKRPLMGGIGARLADLAVFTAEDPRTEDVELIFRHMKEGVAPKDLRRIVTIADRREAIGFALNQAKPGDTVIILGKGHERSLCIGTVEYPWSDQEEVRLWFGREKTA